MDGISVGMSHLYNICLSLYYYTIKSNISCEPRELLWAQWSAWGLRGPSPWYEYMGAGGTITLEAVHMNWGIQLHLIEPHLIALSWSTSQSKQTTPLAFHYWRRSWGQRGMRERLLGSLNDKLEDYRLLQFCILRTDLWTLLGQHHRLNGILQKNLVSFDLLYSFLWPDTPDHHQNWSVLAEFRGIRQVEVNLTWVGHECTCTNRGL